MHAKRGFVFPISGELEGWVRARAVCWALRWPRVVVTTTSRLARCRVVSCLSSPLSAARLPVAIALLAAPPPRLHAVQQDACKGCSETRSKVTRSWMAETRPDAFRALRESVSDGCSRCLSRERLGRPFRARAGVLLPCGERCDLPGKGAVRSQLIPHTMTAFERQYVIAFCHRF